MERYAQPQYSLQLYLNARKKTKENSYNVNVWTLINTYKKYLIDLNT